MSARLATPEVAESGGEGGDTRVGFGWVCLTQTSKFGTHFRRVFALEMYLFLGIGNFLHNPF